MKKAKRIRYDKNKYVMVFQPCPTEEHEVFTEAKNTEHKDVECPDCKTIMKMRMLSRSVLVSEVYHKAVIIGKDEYTCPNCGKTIIQKAPNLYGKNKYDAKVVPIKDMDVQVQYIKA